MFLTSLMIKQTDKVNRVAQAAVATGQAARLLPAYVMVLGFDP